MRNPANIRFSVIAAGNGGLSMAGYLAYKGFSVKLYNRTYSKVRDLINDPRIELSGAVEGTGVLKLVTCNIEEAVRNTDIIMITSPATSHYSLAQLMAPYLDNNQIIVLNPGRTGGALEVYEVLQKSGNKKNIVVAEAQTFIYACRAIGSRTAKIFSVKQEVALATIPSVEINRVIWLLSLAYPQFTPARNVMETSINNFGAIFHPAPTLLNSGLIERGEPFQYYIDGITPSIGVLLEKIDMERIEIANALGVKSVSAKQWLRNSYGVNGDTIYESIQNNFVYRGLVAPKGLDTRYIYEDVPCSLVPLSSLAGKFGIKTPTIDTIIGLANIVTGKDFMEEGRTVKRLGIKDMSISEMLEFVETGGLDIGDGKKEEVSA